MRHYEIVFLVHPDQSDQTQSVLNKFSSIVKESGGTVHRLENIGRRKLVYPIEDQFKASYALLNVECNKEALDEIKSSFKFNDSIIRDLIVTKNKAETDLSALSSQTEQDDKENLGDKEEDIKPQLKSVEEKLEEKPSFIETGGLYGPWPSPKKHNVFAIRFNQKKLIFNDTPETWEFYDLVDDPNEEKNLYDTENEDF